MGVVTSLRARPSSPPVSAGTARPAAGRGLSPGIGAFTDLQQIDDRGV